MPSRTATITLPGRIAGPHIHGDEKHEQKRWSRSLGGLISDPWHTSTKPRGFPRWLIARLATSPMAFFLWRSLNGSGYEWKWRTPSLTLIVSFIAKWLGRYFRQRLPTPIQQRAISKASKDEPSWMRFNEVFPWPSKPSSKTLASTRIVRTWSPSHQLPGELSVSGAWSGASPRARRQRRSSKLINALETWWIWQRNEGLLDVIGNSLGDERKHIS